MGKLSECRTCADGVLWFWSGSSLFRLPFDLTPLKSARLVYVHKPFSWYPALSEYNVKAGVSVFRMCVDSSHCLCVDITVQDHETGSTFVIWIKTKLLPVNKSISDRLRLCNILRFSTVFCLLKCICVILKGEDTDSIPVHSLFMQTILICPSLYKDFGLRSDWQESGVPVYFAVVWKISMLKQ